MFLWFFVHKEDTSNRLLLVLLSSVACSYDQVTLFIYLFFNFGAEGGFPEVLYIFSFSYVIAGTLMNNYARIFDLLTRL